jgi:transcriptional regulator with XRE-family HTH domain
VRDSQVDKRERNLVLWLQKQRVRQGISATQLAARIGMSRAAITHIEANRCRPTLATLLKISDGLRLKPSKWKW